MITLRPSARYLSQLFKLRVGDKLGIVGYSKRFAQLMHTTCKTYVEEAEVFEPVTAVTETELKAYISDKSMVLVPKSYEKYFGAGIVKLLKDFDGVLVDCYYEMDWRNRSFCTCTIYCRRYDSWLYWSDYSACNLLFDLRKSHRFYFN